MELRRYWDIVWRRLPVVLAVPLLVLAGSLALFLARPVTYTATTRVQLELIPQQANNDNFFRYNDYYNYLATEYAVDDLVEVLNGNVFQADVVRTLQGPPYSLPVTINDVAGSLDVTRKHRVLEIAATSRHRDGAMWIAEAATRTLQQDPAKYFSRGDSQVKLSAAPLVIERPLAAYSNRIRSLFNIALQTLLGLVAGLGLAFLLDYLDDSLRGAEMVREALGLPVLGQVPANGHRRLPLPARRSARELA